MNVEHSKGLEKSSELESTAARDTLWLAQNGWSPEDVRRSLDRALAKVSFIRDQRSWEEFEIDRYVGEGGR